MIFAVDAGSEKSAFVFFNPQTQRIESMAIEPNEDLVKRIGLINGRMKVFVWERIASFGFPIGKEVLDTAEWNGRFRQAAEHRGVTMLPVTRKQNVVHHTGTATGGDSAIRTAMITRFGKENLKGCVRDLWSALSLAAYASDHSQKVSVTSK